MQCIDHCITDSLKLMPNPWSELMGLLALCQSELQSWCWSFWWLWAEPSFVLFSWWNYCFSFCHSAILYSAMHVESANSWANIDFKYKGTININPLMSLVTKRTQCSFTMCRMVCKRCHIERNRIGTSGYMVHYAPIATAMEGSRLRPHRTFRSMA